MACAPARLSACSRRAGERWRRGAQGAPDLGLQGLLVQALEVPASRGSTCTRGGRRLQASTGAQQVQHGCTASRRRREHRPAGPLGWALQRRAQTGWKAWPRTARGNAWMELTCLSLQQKEAELKMENFPLSGLHQPTAAYYWLDRGYNRASAFQNFEHLLVPGCKSAMQPAAWEGACAVRCRRGAGRATQRALRVFPKQTS
jgi:hypothetical protein